jgi:hypothetical protein
MNSLAALLLFGTPTAPTPPVRDLVLEATPGFILKANGYIEGFASSLRPVVPPMIFT